MSEKSKTTIVKAPDVKRENRVSLTQKPELSLTTSPPIDQILLLQKIVGNQTVQRLFKTGDVQRKLGISGPNDIYEQEADRVAEMVICMPGNTANNEHRLAFKDDSEAIQMKPGRSFAQCTSCGRQEIRKEPLKIIPMVQRQAEDENISPDFESSLNTIRGSGQLLPESTRNFFEPRFGYDFSSVRIHTDGSADKKNRELNAKAFTLGNNIYFRAGQYAPQLYEGKHLLAHELTHEVQQATGSTEQYIQRSTAEDIRTEATLPSDKRTPGRLGQLETQARSEADEFFQQLTGKQSLQAGTTGRATQIINHVVQQIGQMENARARGYQQAASAILGQQALNTPQASSFWLAFTGNTLWALSGLVPLLGPTVNVARIALAAGREVLLPTTPLSLLGHFLHDKGGAIASTTLGVAGAELAQFSGGTPSGSALPTTLQAIQTKFTNINSRVMSKYRSDAIALSLEYLGYLQSTLNAKPQTSPRMSAIFLENFVKGCIMETLFADLNTQGILDLSNYTINTGQAQDAAKNDLLQAFVIRFGTVRDVILDPSRHEIGERLGAAGGVGAALAALGGEAAFVSGLPGTYATYALVLGNVNGTLSDWGARNSMSLEMQNDWNNGFALASGSHTVPFTIENKQQFARQLSRNPDYEPLTEEAKVMCFGRQKSWWNPDWLPSIGTARFVNTDYRPLSSGGRTVFGLQKLTLEFIPLGGNLDLLGHLQFHGQLERIMIHISSEEIL